MLAIVNINSGIQAIIQAILKSISHYQTISSSIVELLRRCNTTTLQHYIFWATDKKRGIWMVPGASRC